ncbi:membrane protein [Corynebacterium kutscheri]|uniref:Membrane protein n=1 Tax=Corynebacterium kutscheri TaxID=35755 RepID=A0A0F6R1U4_9CORY|nr:NfeD family protein [Corynebacterium kutscheri]AKE41243.1 membrane protein implicated in regulation of membrane protease activity [Corynebacterium kutscheri]VEH08519.1 membrane protein [Corynebacterium kutscheri]VEH09565.1 membrane protein [Corynebacterium kutscheri]VEH79648.1 membrane protein [Corynebacterium kutscheri]
MGALIWFITAIALASAELFVGELTLLMLGSGALAAAGIALFNVPLWVEILIFSLVSIGMLFFIKPALKKRMHQPLALDTSHNALVGKQAEVLETVTAHSGMVRLDGDIWSARSFVSGEEFSPHEYVQVYGINGSMAMIGKEI